MSNLAPQPKKSRGQKKVGVNVCLFVCQIACSHPTLIQGLIFFWARQKLRRPVDDDICMCACACVWQTERVTETEIKLSILCNSLTLPKHNSSTALCTQRQFTLIHIWSKHEVHFSNRCRLTAEPTHPPTLSSTPTVEMSTSILVCFLCSSPTEEQLLGILHSVPFPSIPAAWGASWSLRAQPQVQFERSDTFLCVALFTRLL